MRPEHDQDAAELLELYRARLEAEARMAEAARAGRPVGSLAGDVLARANVLEVACAHFHRRHYPRRGEVFVAGFTEPGVYVRSAGGRDVRHVYPQR